MDEIVIVGIAGFCAAMVDGALGMGFGPTSSTVLLAAGLPPASASATVNVAKVASGAAAGISHWRFGNINRRLVAALAVPGVVGAILGTTLLSQVDGKALRPWLAVLLLVVGCRILLRFRHPMPTPQTASSHTSRNTSPKSSPAESLPNSRLTMVVGALGGITNGLIGAWGPVVTPYLLQKNVTPRITVGSVNTAEVAVASASAASLSTLLFSGALDLRMVLAMLVGGVLAAPLAAMLVKFLPPRPMGLAVALLLLITNVRELAPVLGIGSGRWFGYLLICALTLLAALQPRFNKSSSVAA